MKLLACALLFAVVAGCTSEDPAFLRSSRQAIVDGTVERDEPAVVVIKAFSGVGLCTGTLITDRVIVTAKHCVQAPGATVPYVPSSIQVGFGWQASSTEDVRAASVLTTPGMYESSPTTGIRYLVGVDVGLITLREPITDVTPIPVGREPATELTGSEFTAIGFGQTPTGGAGTKYRTTSTVQTVDSGVLYTAQTICQGDSGGPMIIEGASPAERRVVGVASFGEAGACPSSRDGYNRLDTHLGMIDQAIIASGGCPVEGPEECNSIDDDCDGEIDEGCSTIGESCSADTDCAFAQLPERFEALERPVFCEDGVCTRACDPMTPRAGCGEIPHPFLDTATAVDGAYCRSAGACEGRCAPGTPGSAGNGQSCERDTDCASLFCADPGDGNRRCLSPCTGGAGHCFAGEVCAAGGGLCGGCLSPDLVSGARAIGEPCAEHTECGEGLCFVDGPYTYCSRTCEDDSACGDGFHCREGSCARGDRSVTGETCVSTADCAEGDSCAEEGERRYCTHNCSLGTSCPDGFLCIDNTCTPADALDGERCSSDEDCVSGECADAGDGNRCVRACGPRAPCPAGLECRRLGSSPDGVCAPPYDPQDEGCSATGSPRGAAWWALALLGLGLRARGGRRRRAGG